jgi:hypothetical protein
LWRICQALEDDFGCFFGSLQGTGIGGIKGDTAECVAYLQGGAAACFCQNRFIQAALDATFLIVCAFAVTD